MPNVNRIVVDTNVISYVFKKDSQAELYRKDLDNKQLIVSLFTSDDNLSGRCQTYR